MSTIQTNIANDRECDHCGYNLKGLPMGSKCPECGASIRRVTTQTSGTIMDEAPTRFVRKLRMGFLLASLAIILQIMGAFISGVAFTGIDLISSLMWVGGIFIVTLPRPNRQNIRKDKVLDNDKFRMVVRVLNITWIIDALVNGAFVALLSSTTGGSAFMIGALGILSIITGAAAWICMIPTSVYIAELAYWTSNNTIADRLRGAAWVLAVVGSLYALLTGILVMFNFGLILLFLWMPGLLIFIATLVYNYSIIQMTNVMHWVIKNQEHAAGSFDRMEERRKKEEQYKGRIVDDTPCDYCGYNLIGLEPGSACPECGTLVSHPTRPEIRDPAQTKSYHDNTPIDVDEHGENKGVYFNDQLDAYGKPKSAGVPYTPATEVPDEGDIPLSMDDDPEQPKQIKHENRDDGKSIKPMSFDDES